jgi:hypothetical protein
MYYLYNKVLWKQKKIMVGLCYGKLILLEIHFKGSIENLINFSLSSQKKILHI